MTTRYDVMRWQLLALAVGLFPGRMVAAADLVASFSAARLLYEERRYAEARAAFHRLATDQPDNVEVNFHLGRLALWHDDGPAALRYLERALKAAPNEGRIHNALGDAYGLMAQQAHLLKKLSWAGKCLAAYEKAVELEPHMVAFRWSLVGYACVAPRIAGGSCERARAQAREIARLDATNGRTALATVYLAERKFAEAFAQFDEVLAREPDNFMALYQVGRCAALSGEQLERGRLALERCLRLVAPSGDGMPTLASVHHRLGNIREKLGNEAAARQHYAEALRVQPDFRAEKEALRN